MLAVALGIEIERLDNMLVDTDEIVAANLTVNFRNLSKSSSASEDDSGTKPKPHDKTNDQKEGKYEGLTFSLHAIITVT